MRPIPERSAGDAIPSALYRIYSGALGPFVNSRVKAWALLGVTFVLFAIALALGITRSVPLKMLPFDNKNELQIVIDPPEGTALERPDALARKLTRIVQSALR